jgi:UDP-galactopyranose mutase
MRNKILIIGAGITGITLAEKFAFLGNKVWLVEKRNHIGGNCYDFENKDRILIHKYGPHIFHTSNKEVWDYLSQFTDWLDYQHKVLGFIDGEFAPIPFNFNTLYKLLPKKKAKILEKKLLDKFGYDKKVSILDLKKIEDKDLKFLADFVYEKIFLHYTEKQWGLKPEEINPEVTGRVPIITSQDDRYFQDKYQGIPKKGFTKMFERMINNKNIKILLKTDFKKIKDKIEYDLLFYTGPIDEFFDYKFGRLMYRYLKINFQTFNQESFQPVAVVNYPNLNYPFTRITEFKKLTQQKHKKTVIGKEFPGEKGFTAWPILENKNIKIFKKYWRMAENLKKKNIYFTGRLAEYKYYDMDDAVKNALSLFDKINHEKK